MEKDQLDSLATVAVGSEKMPPPHSHYAPSEVYSASESPPAYTRPPMRSTAVQIARIIATTMIAISVIIGSFILASAWLQARASCTPESIAAMQAQLQLQQSQNEFIKHLQPEALVQDRDVTKDNLQSLSDASSTDKDDEVKADTKDMKVQDDEDSKTDNENGEQTDQEDDYDDGEFPPVHIKLPLQLDLDDIAGSLLQQARSIVSCVVERRRSDEVMDGANDNNALTNNSTERQRVQRLSGERVAILCESGDPRQEQQEQEMLTPIIVPLGTVQIPIQPQDNGYNHYQVHNQYQVPESQRVPMPMDARGMRNPPFPVNMLPPELRNLPQVSMEMGPPPRMAQPNMMRQQPIEMRQIPIEIRHMPMDPMRAMMKPSVEQEQQQQQQQPQQQQQHIPMMFVHQERPMMYHQEQQTQGMMPPPPPHPVAQETQQQQQQPQQQIHEPRVVPSMMIPPRVEQRQQQPSESQEVPDRPSSPFHGIPMEIRRIIQQVPMEIKNIIQHITGEIRPGQSPVPEGARREQVQEFKPFPEMIRPIPVDPFALPIEVRNLFEHGNIEGRVQQRSQDSEEQQEQAKPYQASENQAEEAERKFPVPAEVMNILHQVVEGRAFPVPRFAMPLRPIDSLEVPVEARAQVSDNQATEEQTQQHEDEQEMPQQQQQQHQAHMMVDHQEMQDESNRPHYVQPRSVRSVPEPFAHPREKRVRRCACNCAC